MTRNTYFCIINVHLYVENNNKNAILYTQVLQQKI